MDDDVRVIPNTNGLYSATSDGRIISNGRISEMKSRWGSMMKRPCRPKVMSPFVCRNGYLGIDLSIEKGVSRKHLVHRLVASAFLGFEPDLDVNHKDFNRQNNHVDNLEWLTTKENCKYTVSMKRHGNPHGKQKLSLDDRTEVALYAIQNGTGAASRKFNILRGYACRLKRRFLENRGDST